MKKILLLTILFILTVSFPVFAGNSSSNNIKVDHLAGFFEKVSEKVNLNTKFNSKDKIVYQKELTEKRLAEIEYVMSTGELDPIEETASRYMTYLNKLLSLIEKNKKDADKDTLLKMAENHKTRLVSIQKNFEYETGWWILIQHDINSIDNFSKKVRSL